MSRVRVESTPHTSQVRVESLLIHIESESSQVHSSYESSPSRVPIDPHRVRVESTTHTSQVRVESLLIHVESESSPSQH